MNFEPSCCGCDCEGHHQDVGLGFVQGLSLYLAPSCHEDVVVYGLSWCSGQSYPGSQSGVSIQPARISSWSWEGWWRSWESLSRCCGGEGGGGGRLGHLCRWTGSVIMTMWTGTVAGQGQQGGQWLHDWLWEQGGQEQHSVWDVHDQKLKQM